MCNLANKGCRTRGGHKRAKLIGSSFSLQLFCVDEAFRKGVLGRQCEVGRCEMHLNNKSVTTSACNLRYKFHDFSLCIREIVMSIVYWHSTAAGRCVIHLSRGQWAAIKHSLFRDSRSSRSSMPLQGTACEAQAYKGTWPESIDWDGFSWEWLKPGLHVKIVCTRSYTEKGEHHLLDSE